MQRVENLVDMASSLCLEDSSSIKDQEHWKNTVGRPQSYFSWNCCRKMSDDSMATWSHSAGAESGLSPSKKTPCRKTCAVEHALLLQYSAPLTNATALLHPTHHLHYSKRKKIFLSLIQLQIIKGTLKKIVFTVVNLPTTLTTITLILAFNYSAH